MEGILLNLPFLLKKENFKSREIDVKHGWLFAVYRRWSALKTKAKILSRFIISHILFILRDTKRSNWIKYARIKMLNELQSAY